MTWLYLFHGNNNLASFRMMQQWVGQYSQKYTESGLFTIDATDYSSEKEMTHIIANNIMSQSLFSNKKLIVIKRVGNVQKKGAYNWYRAIVDVIEMIGKANEDTVVLFWEELALGVKNPLLKLLQEKEKASEAKIYEFNAPSANGIKAYIQKNLSRDVVHVIKPDALNYLVGAYEQYGRYLAQKNQLRTADELAQDERLWWIESVLESSKLMVKNHEINMNIIKTAVGELEKAISPFDFAKNIQVKNMKYIEDNFQVIERQYESDDFFSLWAAWRWYWTKYESQYALELLGQIEIFVKNGLLEPIDATARFIALMLDNEAKNHQKPLLDLRKAWLANLPRG